MQTRAGSRLMIKLGVRPQDHQRGRARTRSSNRVSPPLSAYSP
jgi:hypothetical protein